VRERIDVETPAAEKRPSRSEPPSEQQQDYSKESKAVRDVG